MATIQSARKSSVSAATAEAAGQAAGAADMCRRHASVLSILNGIFLWILVGILVAQLMILAQVVIIVILVLITLVLVDHGYIQAMFLAVAVLYNI